MEVHALLRRTPILLAEQMLNEEMHDGQRRKHDGARLARFNLSWILQGEVTGDGELPKPLQGGK